MNHNLSLITKHIPNICCLCFGTYSTSDEVLKCSMISSGCDAIEESTNKRIRRFYEFFIACLLVCLILLSLPYLFSSDKWQIFGMLKVLYMMRNIFERRTEMGFNTESGSLLRGERKVCGNEAAKACLGGKCCSLMLKHTHAFLLPSFQTSHAPKCCFGEKIDKLSFGFNIE
ncbi:CLUMA_CG006134, isoform A [Clunio marinus]|uniref:CLUMA_CG006134, isoform A n=1 Tax=Clunio marinus TaxID=568069 RepID=A0A1J1HWW0_9DIPT|nr:CLUMA_CG006134, isoform A [Clunio marinus]